jgi:glycerate 2-kinase
VNFVRKSLSQLKGGKLADLLAPARILNLIISDEREHKVTAIASGPTVRNDDSESGLQIVQRYGLESMTPAPIMRILESQREPFPYGSKAKISTHVVARREMVLECLKQSSLYDEVVLLPPIEPMPFESGLTTLAGHFNQLAKEKNPGRYLAVSTGELPVIPQPASKGGRNQHLAMSILPLLPRVAAFDFAALASDGCDFLAGVHGACVSESTAEQAQRGGLDINDLKARTASYEFHEKLGTLVQGTYSGTNVSDFYLFDFTK